MRGQLARPVREGGMKKRAGSNPETALHADPTTILRSLMVRENWWPRSASVMTLPDSMC
jgi:hypothetical protein